MQTSPVAFPAQVTSPRTRILCTSALRRIYGATTTSLLLTRILSSREPVQPHLPQASGLPVCSKTPDRNTLYQCTATNIWSNYYKPFTYPHPLQSGTSAAAPPTSLRVTSVQ